MGGKEPSQGAGIVSFLSPHALESVLGNLTTDYRWGIPIGDVGCEIVTFPSPLTLDSGLGKLTMAGIWDGAEPSPADMFRGRLGGEGG